MTREDTIKVLSILKTAYPRFYANMSKTDAENTINLWHLMFSAEDVELVKLALYKLISVDEFPPDIASVRKALTETQIGYVPDAGEAWGSVIEAIRKYGFTREREALETMNPMARIAVKRMGWLNLCMSEDSMADRAHFLKIYSAIEKQESERRQMPIAIQERIERNIALYNPKEEPAKLEMQGEKAEGKDKMIPDSIKAIVHDLKTQIGGLNN